MLSVDVSLRRGSFRLETRFSCGTLASGLVGPSGSGKSTLLDLLSGLLVPDRGRIAIGDRVVVDTERGVFVPAHRRRIGRVFQDARLFPHRSVLGNLRYGARDPREVDSVVPVLELEPLLHRSVRELSGGEAQRVALGRALVTRPDLLLLDEPLASLDRPRRRAILPFVARVRDRFGVPLLYVSHELDEVLRISDELIVLDGGRLVGVGAYPDLALEDRVGPMDLVNVLTCEVAPGPAEEERHLLLSGANGVRLVAPPARFGGGEIVSVEIRPEDVALCRSRVDGLSIQNQIPATIRRIGASGGRALVEIDVGPRLLVALGERSVVRMALSPGQSIVALFKATAVRYL